ncbi:PAS/PAC sensor Signal transduction histidine kinase [Pseudomonas sp. M47T1]|uniref:PAS domain-containing sensor histidine kinase n=1 Tax=Pseudomonas sp. M47T1 TaxID=1179778 RepID=UPI0002608803|nr:PAS domain-containing sensor histidine kinase [Pseudomonas sp. M47T1]EIK96552.1 PAS/PAC sensor Signal transduction histidine kinase [Pseudomonas sp. M47T1]
MSAGEKLFGRWRSQPANPLPVALEVAPQVSSGLQLLLDPTGQVLRLSGPLRHQLATPATADRRLAGYLTPNSRVVVEGEPADWQGQTLDLDFVGIDGTVHTRGWAQHQAEGWVLQVFDVGDLLVERGQQHDRSQFQRLLADMAERLRLTSLQRLDEVVAEQLHGIASQCQLPGVAMLLRDVEGGQWRVFADWLRPGDLTLWPGETRVNRNLAGLDSHGLLDTDLLAPAVGCLVPYRENQGVAAWLLCALPPGGVPPALREQGTSLFAALMGPVLARLAERDHRHQLERLETLQGLMGTGWWEFFPERDSLQLAPGLAEALGTEQQLALQDWLALIHPADRVELQSRLRDVQRGHELMLSVRLHNLDTPVWYRIQGKVLDGDRIRRVVGMMLDISDIKNQQQQAAAAHKRLDNVIASSPAVIYVQRYAEGALQPSFFSDSLRPLLGWTLEDCQDGELAQWVHPDDRDGYFQRTRQLLREGAVRSRYRLRDKQGNYHWLLDEARLLRDDLGMPVEAVGLWLDVTEATAASELVRQSEERYRILVEDSPAMICRYRPDLTLTFGNQPLARYLECTTEQLPGINLGNWLSGEQREAFLLRLATLTPQQPVSAAEINLQLPGREHAWWVWSDRGVFDERGQLIEIQAVGRDNTEVRRTQQQLTQSAKMATLGEMATGLAHEINQPLNVMRMAIVNVLKRLGNGDVQIDYLQDKLNRIDAQVQRAARVVDHMRVFGRRSEIEMQLFNPKVAVEGTLSLLSEGMKGKGVELRVPAMTLDVQVRGHVDQLEQVLINLMVNARDALLSKREGNRELEPWIETTGESDDEKVRLYVQDNGGGIPPRLLEKIFEPFFTTKPVGVGTGLGLSVSYGIIENMGGRLSVVNTEEGARFCIELPIAHPELEASTP